MISLNAVSTKNEAIHLTLLRDRFNQARPKVTLAGKAGYPAYIDFLLQYLEDNLDKILTGSPDEIDLVVSSIKLKFPDFHAQAQRHRSSTAWKKHPRDIRAVQLVGKCFDYDKFAVKGTSWGAYALIEDVGARICPYCQLHHVNYHMPTSAKKSFALRPPLDHFLPRSNYPYLAVSLNNLVPCCSQCNSSVKLALDPLVAGIPHPRRNAIAGQIKFSAQGSISSRLKGTSSDVVLSIVSHGPASAHVDIFKLAERYRWYSKEIFDLIENHSRFLDYPKAVRDVIWMDEFVLGFAPGSAHERALGLCLVDVYKELQEGQIF